MKHRLVSLIVLLTLASVSPVLAAKPIVTIIPFENDILTFEACNGLTITRTLNGTVRVTQRFDKNGDLIVEQVSVHIHGSFANEAAGISLPFVIAETDKVIYNEDGSVTVVIAGLIGRIVVPGEGLITADVGRLVLRYSDAGEEVVFEAGRHDAGPFPFICPYLQG